MSFKCEAMDNDNRAERTQEVQAVQAVQARQLWRLHQEQQDRQPFKQRLQLQYIGQQSPHDDNIYFDGQEISKSLFSTSFVVMKGPFDVAAHSAAFQSKWLLVSILPTRIVCPATKVKINATKHFLLWQVHEGDENAAHYCGHFNVSYLPYMAIINPHTYQCITSWEGHIDANAITAKLKKFSEAHPEEYNEVVKPVSVIYEEDYWDEEVDGEDAQLQAAIAASLCIDDDDDDDDDPPASSIASNNTTQ